MIRDRGTSEKNRKRSSYSIIGLKEATAGFRTLRSCKDFLLAAKAETREGGAGGGGGLDAEKEADFEANKDKFGGITEF